MTEMMDMSSDLVGSGIPFLDYRRYAERIFFPGHRESPLRRDLDVQECRRATVEQGLVQLSNLLNSKLFLTKVSPAWPPWLTLLLTASDHCGVVLPVLYQNRTQFEHYFNPYYATACTVIMLLLIYSLPLSLRDTVITIYII